MIGKIIWSVILSIVALCVGFGVYKSFSQKDSVIPSISERKVQLDTTHSHKSSQLPSTDIVNKKIKISTQSSTMLSPTVAKKLNTIATNEATITQTH